MLASTALVIFLASFSDSILDTGSGGEGAKQSAEGAGAGPWGRPSVWAEADASGGASWEASFCTGEGTTAGAVAGRGTLPVAVSVDPGTAAVAGVSWVLGETSVGIATVVGSAVEDEDAEADFRGACAATGLEVP